MGFFPLVAQQIRRNACEDDAAADQTLERSGPKWHDNHEDAAQHERYGDKKIHLQKENKGLGCLLSWQEVITDKERKNGVLLNIELMANTD